MSIISNLLISGREALPIIEGGKGVAISNGLTAGSFAKAGAIGTISIVTNDHYDKDGNLIRLKFDKKLNRSEKHEVLVDYSIRGGIDQAKIAHDVSGGNGRIHLNMLWEAGGAARILDGVLSGAKGLIHGITAGAGMPYALCDIAAKHNVFYYPIVSSARAFSILWRRSYSKVAELLGGVVYEDPWLAGGHNGISNAEDPKKPQGPFERVREIRTLLNSLGLERIPIIMAGGVWFLREFKNFINNPEIGNIAFQFGTRPLLTKESPISDAWKKLLLNIKDGDVSLNRFSPSGFYSSAYRNSFLKELEGRAERQLSFSREANDEFSVEVPSGGRRNLYVKPVDELKAKAWISGGFSRLMPTPDNTIIFVTPETSESIIQDQAQCHGCLSGCLFSNWSEHTENHTTGRSADPRSFCIHKTLDDVAHGGSIDNNLVFAGHHVYRFAQDPFYKDGFIPTISQLVERIMTGD